MLFFFNFPVSQETRTKKIKSKNKSRQITNETRRIDNDEPSLGSHTATSGFLIPFCLYISLLFFTIYFIVSVAGRYGGMGDSQLGMLAISI